MGVICVYMESSWKLTARTILLSILVGGLAGVASSAFTNTYLSDYALKLGDLTAPLRLSEQRPRAFPSSYEDALSRVRETTLSSAVGLYAPSESGIARRDVRASGVALTSDGWVLSFGEEASVPNRLVAFEGNTTYTVERSVTDPATGAVFVQVSASNLPVLAFGDLFALQAGEQLFILPDSTSLVPAVVTDVDLRLEGVETADVPSRRLRLAVTLPASALGAPIVNLSGELVGIVDAIQAGEAEALPLAAVLPAFSSLLTSGAIVRPSLGIEYVDLARTLSVPEARSRGFTDGALVTRILPGSAAALAKLRVGDVIRSVAGESLLERSLDERLFDVTPGETISFVIDREGESLTLTAVAK